MPALPKEPFTLTGGCFCRAIRYTVSVPELLLRPKIPYPPTENIGPRNEVTERLPQIELDHCNSCRRIQGSIIQSWIILPQSWVKVSLQPKSTSPSADSADEKDLEPETIDFLIGKSDLVEKTYIKHFSSSKNVNRIFCGRCGTHLTFHYAEVGGMAQEAANSGVEWQPHMDLTVGSLDDEGLEMKGMRPSEYAHPGDAVSWVKAIFVEGEKTLVD